MSTTFKLSNIPSTSTILSTYTAFTASAVLVRTVLNEVKAVSCQIIPKTLQDFLIRKIGSFFAFNSTHLIITIEEYSGLSINEIYQASEVYLSTKITPSINNLKVSKAPKEETISVTISKGQQITDEYEGIQLVWEFTSTEKQGTKGDYKRRPHLAGRSDDLKSVVLSFNKEYKDKVLNKYLPYVLERSKALKEENKVIKLYSLSNGDFDMGMGSWGSVKFDHPSSFDTIAIDPVMKQKLKDDLDRFLKRRDFYRKVGKPWKRGYLLHGPPGTGKSSLVAAIANYLKFNIYDLELTRIKSDSKLRNLLTATANRSILLIEDIDCSIELHDRKFEKHNPGDNQAISTLNTAVPYPFQQTNQLTLSGMLNFLDGLWSSCGDERIIVFTTNHKDKLDPALLRPGRMDMHIYMGYCTYSGFKMLANNYLNVNDHTLFSEIENLIEEVEVTPAEVAEQLMQGDDADAVLTELREFLRTKKEMKCKELNTQVKIEEDDTKNRKETISQIL